MIPSSRKRSSGRLASCRRDCDLGSRYLAVARCHSVSSSDRYGRILPGRASLVRALRSPQSRFSSGFYLSTQFRTLPHSYVSASPAVLVFCPNPSSWIAPVDCVPLASVRRRTATLAAEIVEQLARILYRLLGDIPISIFQLFTIKTAGIYPSGDSSARLDDCSRLRCNHRWERCV